MTDPEYPKRQICVLLPEWIPLSPIISFDAPIHIVATESNNVWLVSIMTSRYIWSELIRRHEICISKQQQRAKQTKKTRNNNCSVIITPENVYFCVTMQSLARSCVYLFINSCEAFQRKQSSICQRRCGMNWFATHVPPQMARENENKRTKKNWKEEEEEQTSN